jgi:hypothetical protein
MSRLFFSRNIAGGHGTPGVAQAMRERPEIFAASTIAHLEAGDVFLWWLTGDVVCGDRRWFFCDDSPAMLWCRDDRTTHCNAPGAVATGLAGPAEHALQRAACYVCFTPRAHATREVLGMRELMVERHIGTGHAARHITRWEKRLRAQLTETPRSTDRLPARPVFRRWSHPSELEAAVPRWQPGDVDVVESKAKAKAAAAAAGYKREFTVAPPAQLSAYQRSLVGW